MCDVTAIKNAAVSPYGYDVQTTGGQFGSVPNDPRNQYYKPVKEWMDIHFPAPPDPFAEAPPKPIGGQGGLGGGKDPLVTTVGGVRTGLGSVKGGDGVPRLGGVAVIPNAVRGK